jgi:hypothetical protein
MHAYMKQQLAADRVAELRTHAQRARHQRVRRARRASEASQALAPAGVADPGPRPPGPMNGPRGQPPSASATTGAGGTRRARPRVDSQEPPRMATSPTNDMAPSRSSSTSTPRTTATSGLT